MNKITIHCDGKAITLTKREDGSGVDFLIEYEHDWDVLYLTNEEVSYLIGGLELVLGRKSILQPKEKVRLHEPE